MEAEFDAQLRADTAEFTKKDASLLEAVDEIGSILKAADELGRSYSHSHQRITALEDAFGTLVERQRGGSGGGGSTLTENARELLSRFDRLRTGYSSIAETTEAVLDGTVAARTAELGTVMTAAGQLRAVVPTDHDLVQVSLRADTVTLHDPDETPTESATSARNRFDGHVLSIDRGGAVVLVSVDIGARDPIYALITADSRERLELEPGRQIVASVKATATRATPRQRY
ncbi:MAG: molybdenum-pterin binding domain protein [uncultured archaeon A07HB70]|nr:MAG: molybdenum-pterin binding domain protein [uncultured archaeon A07HB70]